MRQSFPMRFFASLVLLMAACGTPIGPGAVCEVDTDCGPGDQCFAVVTGGYCTVGCVNDADCPMRQACGSLGGESVCIEKCIDDFDCDVDRDDGVLTCRRIAGNAAFTDPEQEGSACLP